MNPFPSQHSPLKPEPPSSYQSLANLTSVFYSRRKKIFTLVVVAAAHLSKPAQQIVRLTI
jgi:hypothetical protein